MYKKNYWKQSLFPLAHFKLKLLAEKSPWEWDLVLVRVQILRKLASVTTAPAFTNRFRSVKTRLQLKLISGNNYNCFIFIPKLKTVRYGELLFLKVSPSANKTKYLIVQLAFSPPIETLTLVLL